MAKSTVMFSGFPTIPVVGIEIDTCIKGTGFAELDADDKEKWFATFFKELENKKCVFPKKMFDEMDYEGKTGAKVERKYDVTQDELQKLRKACLGTMNQEAILDVCSDMAWESAGLNKENNQGVRITLNTKTNVFGSWLQPTFTDVVTDVAKESAKEIQEKVDSVLEGLDEKLKNAVPFLKNLGIASGTILAIGCLIVGVVFVAYVAK